MDELRALLLCQGGPQPDWDALEIARKLYLQVPKAASVLAGLETKRLLVSTGDPPRYRVRPQSGELEGLIKQLVEMDRVRPVTLINLVYDRPKDIQAFADAFKLKRKEGL